jgi:UPF0176 protein
MQILTIAAYKFLELDRLTELQAVLHARCQSLELKGTILLSDEGINLCLAGTLIAINNFKRYLQSDARFADLLFKESYTDTVPFDRLKVKIKKEIITMRCADAQPEKHRAPVVSPVEFKQWLDENRDIVILDTRNDYEVRFGTFHNAINLGLKDFSEFPLAAKKLPRKKPIVMFCTGGIRCEKAATHLLKNGFDNVYQLDGGILNYFSEVGGIHYEGECFVFDQRVAVNAALAVTGVQQCVICQGPMRDSECKTCNQKGKHDELRAY